MAALRCLIIAEASQVKTQIFAAAQSRGAATPHISTLDSSSKALASWSQCGTDELIDITLAGTNVAKGDDLGVVVLGDIGNGTGLFVDLQPDVECARLWHG
jgi:hypothetical protein